MDDRLPTGARAINFGCRIDSGPTAMRLRSGEEMVRAVESYLPTEETRPPPAAP